MCAKCIFSPCDFQTLYPWFPPNYAPVSTPSSYCIGYRVIKDTGALYWTNYILCSGKTFGASAFFFYENNHNWETKRRKVDPKIWNGPSLLGVLQQKNQISGPQKNLLLDSSNHVLATIGKSCANKTSQEWSRSLSDCKSLLLNVMIQVSQFVISSQLSHYYH